jgi:hypothetical protein
MNIRTDTMLISADPDTEQLDRGTASAGCGPGATGKTRVRSLELTGMAVMVASRAPALAGDVAGLPGAFRGRRGAPE